MRRMVRAALAVLLGSAASAAMAAPQFDRVVAFGDSYADSGNVLAMLKDAGLVAFFNTHDYPTGRFSGGTNFVDTTASDLGVPDVNFAIGGAQAGTGNVAAQGLLPGFAQQWQAFVNGGTFYETGVRTVIPAGGLHFNPDDLVLFSVGGNDARGYRESAGSSVAGAVTAANTSATQATTGLDALLSRGLRHMVWTAGDVGLLPEINGEPAQQAIGTSFSTTYNNQMQGVLAGVAKSGVQVAYVDITTIALTIRAHPGLFGITNTTTACPSSCVGNTAEQNTYLFYVDGLHLTSAGFAAVARYGENQIEAPYALRQVGDAPRLAAAEFGQQLGSRADLTRGTEKHGLSVWGDFTANKDRAHATADSDGYDVNGRGGIGGVEYGSGPGAIGVAFAYTNSHADGVGDDRTKVKSYQVGGYGAVDLGGFFAQGYYGYGWHHLDVRRTGVAADLTADPHATSIVAGARTGYLMPMGPLKVGPSVGLDYSFARLHGYTEAGDPAAALVVDRQKIETLLGSAGLEARGTIGRFTPWLRASAEYDFAGDGRTLFYAPAVAASIVNAAVYADRTQRTYGAVDGGLSAALVKGLALQFTGHATFARQGGNDAGGLVGLKFGF